MGRENAMIRTNSKGRARTRSPGVDADSVPCIYDRTMQAVGFIEHLSDHDPGVSKVITSCSTLMICTKGSETSDPYLMIDEIMIDRANHHW